MAEIWVMGEMIVEIMRTQENVELDTPGLFRGPFPSGAPAIFIDTVAKLGHSAGIIGGVGKDDFGRCLLERMQQDKVDISKVIQSEENSTGCAFVTYYSDGSRKFLYHIGNTPAAAAKAPDKKVFEGIRYFHIMGCSLMANQEFAAEILKAMYRACEMGAEVSFDPNIRKELLRDESAFSLVDEVMKKTSIFMPGVEELLLISGQNTIEKAVETCFENPALKILALKNGSKGCRIYTRDGVVEQGIYRVEPIDATGAGDSFDGAFLCALLEQRTIAEAAKMASAAGALNTAAFGPMEGKISQETVWNMILNLKEEGNEEN